jgi:hypothetical protein
MTQSHLPTHPRTGLVALGFTKRGTPIWPVRGGDGTGDLPANPPAPPAPTPPTPPVPPADPAVDDKPLGPAGEKALAAEREARKALEKQVADLAPLAKLAQALGGTPTGETKTDLELLTDRLAAQEKSIADERSARWRAEVANEKGLTPQQAARLVGATRDELVADADALVALFPTAPGTPGTPRPDPSQGSRGGAGPDLDALIAEAQKAGDWTKVISLQNQKLATLVASQKQ